MINIEINLDRPLGEFQIRKLSSSGEVVYDSGICKNVVTDNFYYQVYNNGGTYSHTSSSYTDFMRFCAVSNDNNEVLVSDINLAGQISSRECNATSNAPVIENIGGQNYYKLTKRYTWVMGAFNNVTIAKVGLVYNNSADSLIAGQLIRDGFGQPVTITILEDEQLDITYTLYVPIYANIPSAASGTMILNAVEYTYTVDLNLANLVTGSNPLYFNTLTRSSYSGNTFVINATAINPGTRTRTQYPNRVEFTYVCNDNVGLSFNPITNVDYGRLAYKTSWYDTIDSTSTFQNLYLVRYNFTSVNKPIKLSTDAFESTIKITLKWGT